MPPASQHSPPHPPGSHPDLPPAGPETRTLRAHSGRPRPHKLRVIPKPIPHQPVEHTHLLGDLGGYGLEIGARTHDLPCAQRSVLAPACSRRLDGLLEPT